MSEVAEKETEVVAGVIGAVIQKKADTWQVEVTPDGSQYSKKLWTKDSELVASLSAKLGQAGAFVCNASYWTNQSGAQVRSLWIATAGTDGAALELQNATVTTTPQPGGIRPGGGTKVNPQHTDGQPVDWDAKERRDYRSRAWAQTLGAFQHTIKVDEDPGETFKRLQPFQRKVYEDVCQSFAYPSDDSDIPFG